MAWLPESGDTSGVIRRKFDLGDDPPEKPAEPSTPYCHTTREPDGTHVPYNFCLPQSWGQECPLTIQAIRDQVPKLANGIFSLRLDEAIDVDRRVRENGFVHGSTGWTNPEIRDRYLRRIIEGELSFRNGEPLPSFSPNPFLTSVSDTRVAEYLFRSLHGCPVTLKAIAQTKGEVAPVVLADKLKEVAEVDMRAPPGSTVRFATTILPTSSAGTF